MRNLNIQKHKVMLPKCLFTFKLEKYYIFNTRPREAEKLTGRIFYFQFIKNDWKRWINMKTAADESSIG